MTDNGNPFGSGVIRRPIAATPEQKAGALVVGAPVQPAELQLHCLMYREAARDYPGSGEVVFEEDTDAEWYSAPSIAGAVSQAVKWQRLMDWPREPTPQEAEAWKASADAEAYNALVNRVGTFRAELADCEALARLGGIEFWRIKMALPADQRTRLLTVADIGIWLATETSPVARAQWTAQLKGVEDEE